MSFITAIESELAKAEKILASWWGKEPAFANVLATGINIAGAALETVFTLEGNGPASTIVGNVVSKAQQEILAVNSLVTTVGPTPSAKSILARRGIRHWRTRRRGEYHQPQIYCRNHSGREHGQCAGQFVPGGYSGGLTVQWAIYTAAGLEKGRLNFQAHHD